MGSSGDLDLLDLSEDVRTLTEGVELCGSKIGVVPEYIRCLWENIQTLKNVVQYGTALDLNFSIIEAPETAQALDIIRRACDVVNDLRIVVQKINDAADPAEAVTRVSTSDCIAYSNSLTECREKLTTSLNLLQM
jgi:hypothetical protein